MKKPMNLDISVPIMSVNVLDRAGEAVLNESQKKVKALTAELEQLRAQNQQLVGVCSRLDQAVGMLNQAAEQVMAEYPQQIAKLSVAIAEKILQHELAEGNYDIEKIVTNALSQAPSRKGVSVKVSPADHAILKEKMESGMAVNLQNIIIETDQSLSAGECVVETDKGIVDYIIYDNLERIEKAISAGEQN